MIIAIYAALWLTFSFALAIFGFMVGRCSRKLPILDENMPRALYRSQIPTWNPPVASESSATPFTAPESDFELSGKQNLGDSP